MLYGEPRYTNDVDVVIDVPFGQIRDPCAAFPAPEVYVSEESARRAVAGSEAFLRMTSSGVANITWALGIGSRPVAGSGQAAVIERGSIHKLN
jgi:hypothetical protein